MQKFIDKRDAAILYKLIGEEEFKVLPETIEDSTKVERFHASYSFEINDNIDDTTGQPNRTVKKGDYYYIQFLTYHSILFLMQEMQQLSTD